MQGGGEALLYSGPPAYLDSCWARWWAASSTGPRLGSSGQGLEEAQATQGSQSRDQGQLLQVSMTSLLVWVWGREPPGCAEVPPGPKSTTLPSLNSTRTFIPAPPTQGRWSGNPQVWRARRPGWSGCDWTGAQLLAEDLAPPTLVPQWESAPGMGPSVPVNRFKLKINKNNSTK